jgi:hypothetical protein
MRMSDPSAPSSTRKPLAIAAVAIGLVACVTAWLVAREVVGPRGAQGPAPAVQVTAVVRAVDGGTLPIPDGASVPASATLNARVELTTGCLVSLVHINVGHGMQALVLNVPLQAGAGILGLDGGAVQLSLDGLSGPQRLTAVAASRELTMDEALSAGRGLIPPAVGVSSAAFVVAP